jgi:diadenosine tetraphosphate (Ap4A) HIT family hydrolase
VFCNISRTKIIVENDLAYAIYDKFPVTKYHTLIISKRHIESYFGLNYDEVHACDNLLSKMQLMIEEKDKTVKGFNLGINCGEVAGQTVFHCHIHLIPRREGDVKDPVGGIRHVIPGKGNYKKEN